MVAGDAIHEFENKLIGISLQFLGDIGVEMIKHLCSDFILMLFEEGFESIGTTILHRRFHDAPFCIIRITFGLLHGKFSQEEESTARIGENPVWIASPGIQECVGASA